MFKAYDLAPFLFLGQLVLLVVHQIDSYRAREWEMSPFDRLRMTPTGFDVATVVLAALALVCLLYLIAEPAARSAVAISWGIVGLIVPVFHTYHYIRGDRRFRGFFSILVIYLTGLISLLLIVAGVD
jgi:hypothetical protein